MSDSYLLPAIYTLCGVGYIFEKIDYPRLCINSHAHRSGVHVRVCMCARERQEEETVTRHWAWVRVSATL